MGGMREEVGIWFEPWIDIWVWLLFVVVGTHFLAARDAGSPR